MKAVAPATLVTFASPEASIDVAARSDCPLADLVTMISSELGLDAGPWSANLYRVASPVRRLEPTASLSDAGVLDGDLLHIVPGTDLPPRRRGRQLALPNTAMPPRRRVAQ